jgi:hypothetical protein
MKQFDNLKRTKEDINKNLFKVEFDFEELTDIEKNILQDHVNKINDNSMEFELVLADRIVQPLDILIRLKNNKSTGDVLIRMLNKDDEILGIFKFKTFKVTEINDLIDFDYLEETTNKTSTKTLTIHFIYDDIFYSNDSKVYEKLT